jgi:hypothetical protein
MFDAMLFLVGLSIGVGTYKLWVLHRCRTRGHRWVDDERGHHCQRFGCGHRIEVKRWR